MNNVEEIKCSNIEDFIKKVSYKGELYKLFEENFIFRGESSDKYKLIPSALREENHRYLEKYVNQVLRFSEDHEINRNSEYFQIIAEYLCLYLFYLKCDYRGLYVPDIEDLRHKTIGITDIDDILYDGGKKYWLPANYIELAGLAQHYGVYTRLLDWSRDINIALYFALSGSSLSSENIVIWALNTNRFSSFQYNSPGIKLFVPKYAGNPNLCAQKGVFSLYQTHNATGEPGFEDFDKKDMIVNSLDEIIEKEIKKTGEPILYKILIPTPNGTELYDYLYRKGYDASLIFPGYSGVTKFMKELIR